MTDEEIVGMAVGYDWKGGHDCIEGFKEGAKWMRSKLQKGESDTNEKEE